MEDLGAQVAPPIFFHQGLPGRLCEVSPMLKKRDLPWRSTTLNHQAQHLFNSNSQHAKGEWNPLVNSNSQPAKGDWSPMVWDWDSSKFLARPSEAEVLQLGSSVVESGRKKDGDETFQVLKKSSVHEDGEKLALKLGGSLYSVDDSATRPNKRVRSGSPGTGSYPMCQVDDCRGDLSNAKDYHRRHKVCELHSKTIKALVGQQMQRFCQQCSRFHPLSEFDEGKRSCRRRLAGHNRRRRKTQPDDVSSRFMIPGSRENGGNGNLDVVNLLTILTRLQGNNIDRSANTPPIPEKDRLIQIISKINNSLPVAANSASWPPSESFDLNVSQPAPLDHSNKINGNTSSPSTTDLLTVLSAALAPSPDSLGITSQRSSHGSDDDKTKLNCVDQHASVTSQKESTSGFPLVGERSNSDFRSPIEISDCQIQESQPSLTFQLFSSSPEGDSPPKLESSRKYFSSDSSNPMEERSLSSSPVMQKLFPMQTSAEIMKLERASVSVEDNGTVEASSTRGWSSALELFKGPNGRVENGSVQIPPYQAGYASSSGSDHSPSSSNSDAQDRTGRIIFKLFDKDPSDFPGTLRTQIYNWLSHCPAEMESYIRPGCVVLSVYVSMPSTAWDQLQEDLLLRVNSLIQDPDSDFWRSGRFLVHTDRKLVSHKDGIVRLCKSWRTWSAPELVSVSPLAIVGGKETSLVLKGRNLTVPGTKIHCTYMGGYISKEVSGLPCEGIVYDNSSLEILKFTAGAPGVLGRCFIEVENSFKGNCFPVIIADDTICQELNVLESEFEEGTEHLQDFARPRSREDILHFLNELGWVLQGKSTPLRSEGLDSSYVRFKYLFTFSVDRGWCALVKTLLDILMEKHSGKDGVSKECMEALSEIHLLNRAVKRKCRSMVKLLVHYSLTSSNASKKYLFPPNLAGPGGVTPLHLAASMKDSEDLIDALTNDPQEIGLSCWASVQDANGQSPYAYASMRNNHSYNRIVARKLADRKHGQVTIAVGDELSLNKSWIMAKQAERQGIQSLQRRQSCTRCVALETRYKKRIAGAQGLIQRPYVHSMLAVAAVCVCVCILFRCLPDVGSVAPFKWENVLYGSI
ncbi:squamosa promoter-binding-like protein 14 [Macadamia integrifolia]|uniref:squamosa promoter-binding-like protein 14 n=1 Tax=Macadamia integrifolia TaxID=60698 RepID=UPI001C4FCED8|nr:squamosa promoter-binding-like protein 14 [Macadamia integrifolia]XP_042494800.1 squamosa promoter-binding-like protein 14 [Macadamia integrifolia]